MMQVPGWRDGVEVYVTLEDGDLVPEDVILCQPWRSHCVIDGIWNEPDPPPRLHTMVVWPLKEEVRADGSRRITEQHIYEDGQLITHLRTEKT